MATKNKAHDKHGCLRPDLTEVDAILDNIDDAFGRPAAVRAFVFALRDLQRAHDLSVFADAHRDGIDNAKAAVEAAFDRLVNVQIEHELEWRAAPPPMTRRRRL